MRSHRALFQLLLFPLPLVAQSAPDHPVGLGVGILSSISVRVPLRIGRSWRLEPSVGVDFDATNVAQFQGGQPGDTTASSSNVWTVAIVLSRRFRLEELLDFYLGPRLALTRYSSDDELPAVIGGDHLKFHRLDKDVGGVAGAELTLRRRFSIGAEVGAVYRFRGSASVEPQPLPVGVVAAVPTGGHRLFSYGDLVIRWYFGRSART